MIWDTLKIKPTTDLNVIKSAYARLAKQYNPEEHPDEFKRIHDAYISACNYVKIRKMNSSSKGNNVPVQNENKNNKPEENSGLNFSGVNPNNKHSKSKETPKINNNLDFSGVNPGNNHKSDKDTPDRDYNLNFSRFNTSNRNNPANNVPKERNSFPNECSYNFSSINTNYDERSYEKQKASLITNLINKMEIILSDPLLADNYEEWKSFFDKTDFNKIITDYDFRHKAAELLRGKFFSRLIAELIANEFGFSSRAVYIKYYKNKWQVYITDLGQPNNTPQNSTSNGRLRKQHIPKPVETTIIIASVVFFVIFFKNLADDSFHYTPNIPESTSVQFIPLDTYDENGNVEEYLFDAAIAVAGETVFETADLYDITVGRWEFSFGYISFYDDYTFIMECDGQTFKGTVDASAAEKGAFLNITLNAPDTSADKAKVYVRFLQEDGRSALFTDQNGITCIGNYINDDN